jgi:hypothetical protein|tara:strand:- start:79 stop:342 length:264 start_codon:yes stop_codon:yes gene_type:complete
MTKQELRELIRSVIQEYTGTGASGGNAGDGNSIPSQRLPGGSFETDEKEITFYTDKGAPFGGAEGQHTRGMEKTNMGNPNRTRFTKF